MRQIPEKIRDSTLRFLKSENGDEAVELAVLFPIILLIVGFIIDRFVQYEGVTAVSTAANEALRYAIVEDTASSAEKVVKETLTDRLDSSGMGWCTNNKNSSCVKWDKQITQTSNVSTFKNNKKYNLLFSVEKGWCDGGYVKVGVRAHKSSIFPSYESFQNLVKKGGPVYHQHTYIITGRVESNNKCS